MIKINSSPDCGNSPKMEFIKKFNIAFAEGDVKFLTESVTDEIVWNMIGDKEIEGKAKFAELLEEMKAETASELTLLQILSHGKEGAANGIIKMKNGKKIAFSDFYQFKNTKGEKINSITSYAITI